MTKWERPELRFFSDNDPENPNSPEGEGRFQAARDQELRVLEAKGKVRSVRYGSRSTPVMPSGLTLF